MKSLITGAGGMLGRRLTEAFAEVGTAYPYTRSELDVTDLQQVRSVVGQKRPDCILHSAAFTRVDEAESRQEEAYRVNALGSRNVALAAAENDCSVVYFSTDYVFDGTSPRPIREWDPPAPINHYGASKLAGEWMVRTFSPRHLIIRTSWLFGPDGPNFVAKIAARARAGASLRVVDDQRGSPSFTVDVASTARELVERKLAGTYHVTNEGDCSWFELAQNVIATLGLQVEVSRVASDEFPTPAARPRNSVLENFMLRLEGLEQPRSWKDAVRSYLRSADV